MADIPLDALAAPEAPLAALHINDTEVSLLLGLAFVLIYAFSSLPISRLADWASRKLIIACGVKRAHEQFA